jgi:K+-transporting ATPase ATPase C chain
MKTLLTELKTAILVTLVTAIVLCGFYPLIVWGAAQLFFPKQANGSLIQGSNGKIYGSFLLGQNFSGAGYFHSRPSAAGANGYDGASSGGSNLGPTSQKLNDAIRDRIVEYRAANGLSSDTAVPADAVTASASGLDPHISVRNALLQLPRVARERGISEEQLKTLVKQNTDQPGLSVLGESGVNILKLNLALEGKLGK